MKNKNDPYAGVPVTSLFTRQAIYDKRAERGHNWWLLLWIVVIILMVVPFFFSAAGCETPQSPVHPSLVLHVTGTLDNPKVGWEYSRNDEHMGILTDAELRSVRERYERHLSLTIDTIDRQTSVDGRVRDRHTTTTRTTETRR